MEAANELLDRPGLLQPGQCCVGADVVSQDAECAEVWERVRHDWAHQSTHIRFELRRVPRSGKGRLLALVLFVARIN
jgi:hypothetical protein